MLSVCVIIRSLDVGGAERQLVELLRHFPSDRVRSTVLVFYPGGALEQDLRAVPGVTVRSLDKRGRWDVIGFLRRARSVVREVDPHVVVGCLAVAAETALLVGRMAHRPVVWRLGTAYMDFSLYDWAPRALFRLGALLSRFPDAIALNSYAGLEHHRGAGWSVRRMTVIPQGFDVERFCPDRQRGLPLRQAWGVPETSVLVGLPARVDPIKDHRTFLQAAVRAKCRADLRFVCVGGGDERLRQALTREARDLGLADALVWAGHHTDMAAVYNALDVVCLTSLGEGLSNAIGEAMACGVPAVVTDVGDLARLVGQTGRVVPIRDPDALAEAITSLAAMDVRARRRLGEAARDRITRDYSIDSAARDYLALLETLAERGS